MAQAPSAARWGSLGMGMGGPFKVGGKGAGVALRQGGRRSSRKSVPPSAAGWKVMRMVTGRPHTVAVQISTCSPVTGAGVSMRMVIALTRRGAGHSAPPGASPADVQRLYAFYGLDQPILTQYGLWLAALLLWRGVTRWRGRR